MSLFQRASALMKIAILGILLCSALPAWAAPSDNFITKWDTTQAGSSTANAIIIPMVGGTPYDVDWGDGTITIGTTTAAWHDYGVASTSAHVTISGTSQQLYFNNTGDKLKLKTIEQWGTIAWTSMDSAFQGAANLTIPATDAPNLTGLTSLSNMFAGCALVNSNFNAWNVSTVTNFSGMFQGATAFNQPLNNWNVSNATALNSMFRLASAFNQDISSWSTSNVTDMSFMFNGATAFNQPLNSWNTGNVTNMSSMFLSATAFNQPLNSWNTANVTNMNQMFRSATAFNQPLNSWNTGNVTNMSFMFFATPFNQNINSWNTGSVTAMDSMFRTASAFNQPLNSWNTSNVTNMSQMFRSATAFNQPLNSWNTGSVTNMSLMFSGATVFNQPLNSWNTANVTNMSSMFLSAPAFNQPIGSWNTAALTNSQSMFQNATAFNQSIGAWNVSALATTTNMFTGKALSTAVYDAILAGWAGQTLNNSDSPHMYAGNSRYCDAASRAILSGAPNNWLFTDLGLAPGCPRPVISVVTPVPSPTATLTPSVTITSSEAGTTTFSGSCTSATATVPAGTSTITFSALTPGTYSDCTITVTDVDGNDSDVLTLASFTVTNPPVVTASVSSGGGVSPYLYGTTGLTNFGLGISSAITAPSNASSTPQAPKSAQCILFTTPVRLGSKNDPVQVSRLQTFLNQYAQEKLAVDGTYDQDDADAVKRFQRAYTADVLVPWGITEPTGIVFRTTLSKMNELACGVKNFTCPFFSPGYKEGSQGPEVAKIRMYLNFVLGESGVSDVFDAQLTRMVKTFQAQHSAEVLVPWGNTAPTGYWYRTSARKANELIGCPVPSIPSVVSGR